MNHLKPLHIAAVATLLGLSIGDALAATQQKPAQQQAVGKSVTITVDASADGTELSPLLYGVFFEDINFAADGGLYAELVQNRSFEYYPFRPMGLAAGENPLAYHGMTAWETVERGDTTEEQGRRWGPARVSIDQPVDPANPNYVQLFLRGDRETGIANTGYDGIPLTEGADYKFSVFSRWFAGQAAPLKVALETADGKVLAEAELDAPADEWAQQSAMLTPSADADDARLVITTTGQGRLGMDVISLMPTDTFNGRENGLRKDLAEVIAEIEPKTLRFPGGCIVHGNGLAESYRWKDTVGPVEQRRGNSNRWGYHQTYGLGYFEYFQYAEDIGAEPLPILPLGVSCGFEPPYEVARGDELDEWIQDCIDLVEFANGPVDSEWGKVRADMGHPEPFNLKMIGLGNEEHDTELFRENFPKFVEAMREVHPEIILVGNSGLSPNIPAYDHMAENDIPITDEHYYEAPEWFIENQTRFDDFDRNGPKIYVGEYASRGNTLFNAIAEATYLTGIERNGDFVRMTAYAPLLARYGHTQWEAANLIHFGDKQVVRTPNFYVQKLFSQHKGDTYLPAEISSGSASGSELPDGLAMSITRDDENVYVKLVNTSDSETDVTVNLDGVDLDSVGQRTLLTGERDAQNTAVHPETVTPIYDKVELDGGPMTITAPAYSVQAVRIAIK